MTQEQKPLKDKVPQKCCNKDLVYSKSKTSTIDYDADRATCSKCGTLYELNKSSGAVYKAPEKGLFIHMACGTEVDCVWRTHPVWDGLFACSGSGEVDKYPIPFCPKCETEPESTGLPVGEGGMV